MTIISGLLNLLSAKNAWAGGSAVSSQGGWEQTLWGFAPLLAIVVIFYLLVMMPQQKRTKEHRRMLESLRVGDEILTNGGIYGIISGIAEQVYTIEITKDVKIKIAKNAIATKTSK